MNKPHIRRRETAGSVLVVTLVIIGVLCITLGSYLYLVRTENVSVARSQAWNSSLALAEAGVEEAMAQLNPGALLFTTNIDRSANGWGGPSGGIYGPVARSLTNGSYGVVITADNPPVIYSTGYVAVPTISATASRVVQVTTATFPLFGAGMVAQGDITMHGNNVTVNSFDSRLGPYNPLTAGTNGSVASEGGLVDVGNANINGPLYLGPTASNGIGPNGYVSGGIYNDFNMDFPPVLPPSGGITPLSGTVGATTYTYLLDGLNGGNYQLNSSLSGSIYVAGNSILYVTGNANITTLVIAPGASLQLFVGGATTTFGQINDSGTAINLQYYGLPGNTSISLGGNAEFIGTIYAPSADFTANGGGNNTLDIQGAMVVNSVTMNGHFNFHYDVSLSAIGPVRGYLATSWREL